jgi:acyl-CoA thioesterase-1
MELWRGLQLDDLLPGAAVEVTGRLVGEHELRPWREGPRERHALLLATGELGRKMIQPVAEPDLAQHLGGNFHRVRPVAELEGQGHVLERRHGRDQMERLKDDADIGAAGKCELVLAEPGEIVSCDRDAAGGCPLEPRHDHQQRRLARARRADDRDRLSGWNGERDAAQDFYGARPAGQGQPDILQIDDRPLHLHPLLQ